MFLFKECEECAPAVTAAAAAEGLLLGGGGEDARWCARDLLLFSIIRLDSRVDEGC